ncbi:MAG TPA: pantoate--beta-alanine ligase [Dehalococcoidia bacterium]|jgi:pantoate--beta-alanine ligase|nr:pantoate--beta-alanine ligase [Dehalococcoidia bacterium]
MLTTVAQMQSERERMSGTVGLVPTMGYLHEGHLSLVRRALTDNDNVVVSIFVNPTQFGPKEDLARYPSDLDRDLDLLQFVLPPPPRTGEGSGVRAPIVFAPTAEEIYPPGFNDWVEVGGPLTKRLEGAYRPGHFRGVTTVVARLFRIIRPHRAYFGQKDAQQLRVIRRMVVEQRLPVEIVPMPTVREPDGLALSSRNVYLSSQQRQVALALPRALALARDMVATGIKDAEVIRNAIESGRFSSHLDYVSVSNERTLEELETIDRPALVLLAARIGATRLIDNTIVVPPGMPVSDELWPLIAADGASLPAIRRLPAHPEVSKE